MFCVCNGLYTRFANENPERWLWIRHLYSHSVFWFFFFFLLGASCTLNIYTWIKFEIIMMDCTLKHINLLAGNIKMFCVWLNCNSIGTNAICMKWIADLFHFLNSLTLSNCFPQWIFGVFVMFLFVANPKALFSIKSIFKMIRSHKMKKNAR